MPEDEARGDVKGADRTAEMPPTPPEPTGAHSTEPPTQQHPTSEPAQAIPSQEVKSEVKAIEDRIDDRINKSERLMIIFTAVIALFTILLVIVGTLQWSAMRGQLSEMHSGGFDTRTLAEQAKKQATATVQQMSYTAALALVTKDLAERMKDQADQTKIIAGQTIVQAKAATSAAKTAEAALKESQKAFALQNRATLILSGAPFINSNTNEPPPLLPGMIHNKITLINIGRSTAKDVICYRSLQFFDLQTPLTVGTAQQMEINALAETVFRKALTLPSSALTVLPVTDLPVFFNTRPVDISLVQRQALISQRAILLLSGVVKYRDDFQPKEEPMHETEFCSWVFGTSVARANVCGVHTDIR